MQAPQVAGRGPPLRNEMRKLELRRIPALPAGIANAEIDLGILAGTELLAAPAHQHAGIEPSRFEQRLATNDEPCPDQAAAPRIRKVQRADTEILTSQAFAIEFRDSVGRSFP